MTRSAAGTAKQKTSTSFSVINKLAVLQKDCFVVQNPPTFTTSTDSTQIQTINFSQTVAIKTLTGGIHSRQIENEKRMIEAMPPSPYIVTCLGMLEDPLRLVFEYLPVTLAEAVKDATRERRIELAHDIARGLQHMHAHGIVHRDIKGLNILLLSKIGAAKLIDLGISLKIKPTNTSSAHDKDEKDIKDSSLSTCAKYTYTANYAAYENLMGAESRLPASDIFSFGMVLLEIFLTPEEFKEKIYTKAHGAIAVEHHEGKRYKKIEAAVEFLRTNQRCPEIILQLMLACTRKDHTQRPHINSIAVTLQNYLYPQPVIAPSTTSNPVMKSNFNSSSNLFRTAKLVAIAAVSTAIVAAAPTVVRWMRAAS